LTRLHPDLGSKNHKTVMSKYLRHGMYCGAGYCGGSTATDCDYSVAAVDSLDDVCKAHDKSYESGELADRRRGDVEFVDNLTAVRNLSVEGVMAALLIKTKMIVEDWNGSYYQVFPPEPLEQGWDLDVGLVGAGASKGDGPPTPHPKPKRQQGKLLVKKSQQATQVAHAEVHALVSAARDLKGMMGAGRHGTAKFIESYPQFAKNPKNERKRISGRDLIATVAAPATANQGDVLVRTPLIPTYPNTRMALITQAFQKYRFKKAIMHYTPIVPVTQSGSVIGFWDTDPIEVLSVNGQRAVSIAQGHGGKIVQVSEGFSLPVPIDTGGLWLYTNQTGSDRRLFQQAQFFLVAAATTTYTGVSSLGNLDLEWELELMTPQIAGLAPPPGATSPVVAYYFSGVSSNFASATSQAVAPWLVYTDSSAVPLAIDDLTVASNGQFAFPAGVYFVCARARIQASGGIGTAYISLNTTLSLNANLISSVIQPGAVGATATAWVLDVQGVVVITPLMCQNLGNGTTCPVFCNVYVSTASGQWTFTGSTPNGGGLGGGGETQITIMEIT